MALYTIGVALSVCNEAEKVSVGKKRILKRIERVLKQKDLDECFDSHEHFIEEYIRRDDDFYLSIMFMVTGSASREDALDNGWKPHMVRS